MGFLLRAFFERAIAASAVRLRFARWGVGLGPNVVTPASLDS
jgi:hypothetical protein